MAVPDAQQTLAVFEGEPVMAVTTVLPDASCFRASTVSTDLAGQPSALCTK
eukprot:CAMPEP_0170305140 /NCGR_PEP_ID=MMETSP0116_2-20130129/52930_1 /TAXON_ID=400756 /ORGANISM="Durinskia baltica, Strain CSIRO CS-38" /LENGTH=50 /DNA_ID=CAMNT_0010557163 /DNA_START=75 /DNA_END=228 /DNA_ORIENTATION=-